MSKKLKATEDRVWLAGLGALAVAEQEGNDLFQQLVERGKKVKSIEVKVVGAKTLKTSAFRVWRNRSSLAGRFLVPARPPAELAAGRESVSARQARRLTSSKKALLKEFGHPANPEDYEQFLRERQILALPHHKATYIPSFQFDETGQPRPVIAKIIEILGKDLSDWGVALWLTAANGALGDRRPVDLLADDAEQVVQAAEQEAAELVF